MCSMAVQCSDDPAISSNTLSLSIVISVLLGSGVIVNYSPSNSLPPSFKLSFAEISVVFEPLAGLEYQVFSRCDQERLLHTMPLAFSTPTVVPKSSYSPSRFQCARQASLRTRVPIRRIALMSAGEDNATSAEVGAPVESSGATATEGESGVGSAGSTQSSTAVKDAESASASANQDGNETGGILMLCFGNICRSPAAEAVMKNVLENRNLNEKFFVESCGTGGGSPDWYMDDGFSHHVGSPPDVRMQYAAKQRGFTLDTTSRPLTKEDFDKFDYIVAMDSSNLEAIETARRHWGIDEPHSKVMLLSEFSSDQSFRGKGVPDPYYSGQDGFDHALDLIQDACQGLADFLTKS